MSASQEIAVIAILSLSPHKPATISCRTRNEWDRSQC